MVEEEGAVHPAFLGAERIAVYYPKEKVEEHLGFHITDEDYKALLENFKTEGDNNSMFARSCCNGCFNQWFHGTRWYSDWYDKHFKHPAVHPRHLSHRGIDWEVLYEHSGATAADVIRSFVEEIDDFKDFVMKKYRVSELSDAFLNTFLDTGVISWYFDEEEKSLPSGHGYIVLDAEEDYYHVLVIEVRPEGEKGTAIHPYLTVPSIEPKREFKVSGYKLYRAEEIEHPVKNVDEAVKFILNECENDFKDEHVESSSYELWTRTYEHPYGWSEWNDYKDERDRTIGEILKEDYGADYTNVYAAEKGPVVQKGDGHIMVGPVKVIYWGKKDEPAQINLLQMFVTCIATVALGGAMLAAAIKLKETALKGVELAKGYLIPPGTKVPSKDATASAAGGQNIISEKGWPPVNDEVIP